MEAGALVPPPASTSVGEGSRIRLRAHVVVEDGGERIVGRPGHGDPIVVPPLGAAAIRLLDQGLTVGEVSGRLGQPGAERPDIVDFVEGLIEAGLVATVDGVPVAGEGSRQSPGPGADAFPWLTRPRVAWLFGPPAVAIHLSAIVATGLFLARYPGLIPTSADLRFHHWYAVSTLVLVGTGLILLWVHEMGHLAAARAFGLDGRFSLSRRLHNLVAQFELVDAWRVGRRAWLVVYGAGMMANVWVFLLAFALLMGLGHRLPPLGSAWLRLVLAVEWLTTLWQLQLYLRTDVYFIVADLLRARNLMADAQAHLRDLAAWALGRGRRHPLRHLSTFERRAVKVYSALYLVGLVVALVLVWAYVLPFVVLAVLAALRTLAGGGASPAALADAVVTILLYGLYYWLVGRLWWRDTLGRLRRRRKGGRDRVSPASALEEGVTNPRP